MIPGDSGQLDRLRHAVALARQLEDLATEARGGWADTRALGRVQELTRQIRWCDPDGYVRGKLGEVESWAPILYSARKHAPWGANAVHSSMYAAIYVLRGTLEEQLNRLQAPAQHDERPTG